MQFVVAPEAAGSRLDQFVQQQMPEFSRARIQDWIKRGRVVVDGRGQKVSYLVRLGESITVEPEAPRPLRAFAEDIPVDVLYCDDDVIAINKPAGMVVHAGAGRHEGTLVNALLHHFGTLSNISGEDRPGVVHRIDRDTSGVLLVARHDTAHRKLAAQFASRTVEKTYLALVEGVLKQDHGQIDRKITRDPVRRTRMTARLGAGRTAFTEYTVLRRYRRFTYVEVKIGTGRTHQIRVHMASIGHPVAGDALYGAAAALYGRFFLHAQRIRFVQPATGDVVTVEAPLPSELERWLEQLD